jgi:hypothetical protein
MTLACTRHISRIRGRRALELYRRPVRALPIAFSRRVLKAFCGWECNIVGAEQRLELFDPGFEVEYIASFSVSHGSLFVELKGEITDLRGISRFVIGSYPTHATPAFSQDAQLGNCWSQRFLRSLQRLHALTLRKLLLWPPLAPPPWLSTRVNPSGAPSSVGEPAPAADRWEIGDCWSTAEDLRTLFVGCKTGDGGAWAGIVLFGYSPNFFERGRCDSTLALFGCRDRHAFAIILQRKYRFPSSLFTA